MNNDATLDIINLHITNWFLERRNDSSCIDPNIDSMIKKIYDTSTAHEKILYGNASPDDFKKLVEKSIFNFEETKEMYYLFANMELS